MHVLLPAQDLARCRRDLAGRQDAGGHLVEQRLEQVRRRPVDERDVDVGALEGLGGEQPAEAGAHDDDLVPIGAILVHGSSSGVGGRCGQRERTCADGTCSHRTCSRSRRSTLRGRSAVPAAVSPSSPPVGHLRPGAHAGRVEQSAGFPFRTGVPCSVSVRRSSSRDKIIRQSPHRKKPAWPTR